MKESGKLHQEAMEFADQAYLAKRHGSLAKSKDFLQKAFECEKQAALLLMDNIGCEPTRSVLFRSAASLALDCNEIREAERLISCGLSGEPPVEIAEELRDLLENVYFTRHLSLRGITLEPNEFQVSIWGKLVGSGIAQSEEFVGRVKNLEALIYRTAERKSNKPFREAGRRKQDLEKQVELYVSVPRAASFAVSFRLGSCKQLAFPGMGLPEEVINDILKCFELFNDAEIDLLRKEIPDESYYRNFVALAREIAPDGEDVRSVGFTALTHGKEKHVILSTPRSRAPKMQLVTPALPEKFEEVEVRGYLRFADARKADVGVIDIIDKNGKEYPVRVPGGIMNDIVKPMFGEQVVLSGRREGKEIILVNIELDSE